MIEVKTLEKLAKARIPRGLRNRMHRALRPVLRMVFFGFRHECPCCGARLSLLLSFAGRANARCPVCLSLERHRWIWLYIRDKTDLLDGRPKKMLHVAPEPQMSRLFRRADCLHYLSADLNDPKAMVRMDITDIQFPDDTFDVIYCSHVLEHVPEDTKAIREFFRVLRPGGWAILDVPIKADKTFEDPTVTSPQERERLFGRHGHVRKYGPDFKDRLTRAGFSVTVDRSVRNLVDRDIRRYGLTENQDLFFCTKNVKSETG